MTWRTEATTAGGSWRDEAEPVDNIDPQWLAKSQRKQDLARQGVEAEREAEGTTLREDIESGALHAANTLGGSHRWLAAAGPPGMLTAGAIELGRIAAGTDDALEEAEAQSPFGAGVGRGGAQVAQVAMGAPALARGAAAAPGVVEDLVLRGMGRTGSAAATSAAKGSGSGGTSSSGVLRRLREAIDGQGGIGGIFGRKVVSKVLDDDTAKAAFPKPTEPAPSSGIEWSPASSSSSANAPAASAPSPLRSLVRFAAPVDDAAAAAQPRADMPADVMAGDIRAAAVEKMIADANKAAPAARAAPTSTPAPKGVTVQTGPVGAQRVPLDPHAMPGDRNYGVTVTMDEYDELVRLGKLRTIAPPSASLEEAARAMPLARPATPLPITDSALKAAVEQGVRDGKPVDVIAKELSRLHGVRIGVTNLNAFYKNAQRTLPIDAGGYR